MSEELLIDGEYMAIETREDAVKAAKALLGAHGITVYEEWRVIGETPEPWINDAVEGSRSEAERYRDSWGGRLAYRLVSDPIEEAGE